MSRIISTLLALALCLGMTAACAPSESDTTAVEVSTNETPQSEPAVTSAKMLEDDTTPEDTEVDEALSEIAVSDSASTESDNTSEDASENVAITEESTDLISDEEAIKLFTSGKHTVYNWFKCAIWVDVTAENYIYRDYGNFGPHKYYPLSQDTHSRIDDEIDDLADKTEIYYGDHDWMQKNLRERFSERFIEKYFAYEYPYPLIYENGIVYYTNPVCGDASPQDHIKPKVIHKTCAEFAVICEVYGYDWNTFEYDYSKIIGLEYMKFIKSDDSWVIDECYNNNGAIVYAFLEDKIPKEYMPVIPKEYSHLTYIFES